MLSLAGATVKQVAASSCVPDMGFVTLSRPACGLPATSNFVRLTTEARVQHKAVKRMTRNRPIKVRANLLQPQCADIKQKALRQTLLILRLLLSTSLKFVHSKTCWACSMANPPESTDRHPIPTLLLRHPCTLWFRRCAMHSVRF